MSLDKSQKDFAGKVRCSVRAPVRISCLFGTEDVSGVFKATIENISTGGILLSSLPFIPRTKNVQVMGMLFEYPEFSGRASEVIMQLSLEKLKSFAFRAKVIFVREQKNISEVEHILNSKFGCAFEKLNSDQALFIEQYSQTFAKNIVYILNSIDNSILDEKGQQLIRKLLDLLGYDSNQKISLLKQKLLHDYQSLTD